MKDTSLGPEIHHMTEGWRFPAFPFQVSGQGPKSTLNPGKLGGRTLGRWVRTHGCLKEAASMSIFSMGKKEHFLKKRLLVG